MKQFVIASFYKFVPLEDFESLKDPLLNFMKTQSLLGTVILASEGINGSISGTPIQIHDFYQLLRQFDPFSDITFKETYSDSLPFDKAKVKFRKEIVTMGIDGVDPLTTPGEHVSPERWNQLISEPETLIVDTRNDYEVGLGTFKNSVNPKTENFKQFPEYVKNHLLEHKDKKIAMFCTGGIRCEKSTAYLKELGFDKVYQLKGGILNYLDSIPENESLWEGTCFVFDDRIAIEK